MTGKLVLSLFPGIGLLDRAFERVGCCVVRGPDLLWGGDIRRFSPPKHVFWGLIGGPPCQDFSAVRRAEPTGYGREMLEQYARIVFEAEPGWWLLENVARVPDVRIAGYMRQRFSVDQGWWDPVSRLRHWQYGFRMRIDEPAWSAYVDPPLGRKRDDCVPAALACDGRPFHVVRELQGLPADFDLPAFTVASKVAAVGNGVPFSMGLAVAKAVLDAWEMPSAKINPQDQPRGVNPSSLIRCACGCGRILAGRQRYACAACRKREERRRRSESSL